MVVGDCEFTCFSVLRLFLHEICTFSAYLHLLECFEVKRLLLAVEIFKGHRKQLWSKLVVFCLFVCFW